MPVPQFTGQTMSEAPDVFATNNDPTVSLTRRFALVGAPTLYSEALKNLIESNMPNTCVELVDESAISTSLTGGVVLVDIEPDLMTTGRLDELALVVKEASPRPVLLITTAIEPNVLQRLLRDGVAGVVLKSSPSRTLLDAIESVSNGTVWLQRDLLTETFADSSHVRRGCSQAAKIASITARERQIIAVVSCGLTNRQVGEKLNISEPTVRHHLSSIFGKLGVANRGELIIFAYRHRLIDELDQALLC